MRFRRVGRTYQLRLETAEDLGEVLLLDEALWMAASAPVGAFHCPPSFLNCLDSGGNGRIRITEIREAIRWVFARLENRHGVACGSNTLELAALRSDNPEAEALVHSARYVLRESGLAEAEVITLAQVQKFITDIKSRPFNGDGVVVPDVPASPEAMELIRDIVACLGGTPDSRGIAGVNEEQVNRFAGAIPATLAWKEQGVIPAGEHATPIMPLGPKTPDAFNIFEEHAENVDSFFQLCGVLRFNPQDAVGLTSGLFDLEGIDRSERVQIDNRLAAAPLALPNPDQELPLCEALVNPAYLSWVRDLQRVVLEPILGERPEYLTPDSWAHVREVLGPYRAYLAGKPGDALDKLPSEKLKRYLGSPAFEEIHDLLETDKQTAHALEGARDLEKLLLHQQHLMRLVNNFVSFSELYTADKRALFEMGSLVMDGRWFNMAVKVDDIKRHSAIAQTSSLFVVYVEVVGPGDAKYTVAVPITSGTKGNIQLGKRGVFYDVDGREHDAQVVQLIENPISLGEALRAPFVRLWRLGVGKIEAWSGTAVKDLETGFDKSVRVPGAPAVGGGKLPLPIPKIMNGQTVLGLAVGTAALSSAFAFVTKTLANVAAYKILIGLSALGLLVLLPVSLLAIVKLHGQDLSSLLEGAGWAINARMRLSRRQRRQFTTRPRYPSNARGTPGFRWYKAVIVAVVILLLAAGTYYATRYFFPSPRGVKRPPVVRSGKHPPPLANPAAQSRSEGKQVTQ